MSFLVITAEPRSESGEGISSSFTALECALGFARDLVEDGVAVLRIEDESGAVVHDAEAVKKWFAARKRRRAKP